MPTESWDEYLMEELRNPEIASGFLSDAFENGTEEEIQFAMDRVLEANGAKNGHLGLAELIDLRALGLHVSVTPNHIFSD
jgi:hypothetical protein